MAHQIIEVLNSNGITTIVLDGEAAHIIAGEKDTVAALRFKNPHNPELERVHIDADGKMLLGGGRSGGVISGFHPESTHGDLANATAVLDATRGSLELSRFDPGGRQLSIQLLASEGMARIGSDEIAGSLLLTNERDRVTVRIQGSDALLRVGGQQTEGSIELTNGDGRTRVNLDAGDASIRLRLPPEGGGLAAAGAIEGPVTIALEGNEGSISLGGGGASGTLTINDENGQTNISLDGQDAEIDIGRIGKDGKVTLKNRDGINKITLNGQSGRVSAESGRYREIIAIDDGGSGRIHIDGPNASIRVGFDDKAGRIDIRSNSGDSTIVLNGASGNISLGTGGNAGKIRIKDSSGTDIVVLNGATGNIDLGAEGNAGKLRLKDSTGTNTIVLNGATGNASLGADGNGGKLFVRDTTGEDTIVLDGLSGDVNLGSNGNAGNLFVKNNAGENTIHLSGQTGDILLSNADCAEDFDVTGNLEHLDAGTVMVIDQSGALEPSIAPYDGAVAGVISGAGAHRPGIVLDKQITTAERRPIALMGKVYCKVDANYAPIEVGDLLTSSPTIGHAMKARDPLKAFGAVIGKALQPKQSGQGLIPILISLQ